MVGLSLFAYFFQCSSAVQTFIQKSPCQVPRVLDIVDCPPHNIVHDILHYPNYYGPLYYPECYPEVVATSSSVKAWLETSLCSHISLCCPCSSMHKLLGVKFSVQWRDPHYLVCAYADGKLKQCTVSLEDLQSKTYAHCQIAPGFVGHPLLFLHLTRALMFIVSLPKKSLLGYSTQMICIACIYPSYLLLSLHLPWWSCQIPFSDPSKIDTQKISRSQLSCK